MYKGDQRRRTMDIYMNGIKSTTWTSSGTTTAFETVEVIGDAETIELRAVLPDTEWISIIEV